MQFNNFKTRNKTNLKVRLDNENFIYELTKILCITFISTSYLRLIKFVIRDKNIGVPSYKWNNYPIYAHNYKIKKALKVFNEI